MSVAAERPVALAVQALLLAELGPNLVGYGAKPSAGGWQGATPTQASPFKGYAVVYAGLSSPGEGTVAGAAQDALQGWQVSCYGSTAGQADNIRDICRAALVGQRLTLAGRVCELVELADGSLATPDKDVYSLVVFQSADRFTARTTPA